MPFINSTNIQKRLDKFTNESQGSLTLPSNATIFMSSCPLVLPIRREGNMVLGLSVFHESQRPPLSLLPLLTGLDYGAQHFCDCTW